MINAVRSALGRSRHRNVRYECRHCGTALSESEDTCAVCGCADVATYEL